MEGVESLKERLIQLASEPPLSFYDLALGLDALHGEDPGALRDIPQRSGISRRRMYYLLDVGRLIREHKISKARAEGVGWTKLQIIAAHLASGDGEPKELESYLQLSKAHQARALAKALSGQRVLWSRAVQFNLGMASVAELNEALLAFGADGTQQGRGKKESALIRIVRAAMEQKGLGYSTPE